MPNTPTQQTTRSALSGYPADVDAKESESQHCADVRQAIADMEEIEVGLTEARSRRDAGIVAMHTVDNLRPPDIARATGMSVSNVRLVLAIAKR